MASAKPRKPRTRKSSKNNGDTYARDYRTTDARFKPVKDWQQDQVRGSQGKSATTKPVRGRPGYATYIGAGSKAQGAKPSSGRKREVPSTHRHLRNKKNRG
jgi:hypothetical protein